MQLLMYLQLYLSILYAYCNVQFYKSVQKAVVQAKIVIKVCKVLLCW